MANSPPAVDPIPWIVDPLILVGLIVPFLILSLLGRLALDALFARRGRGRSARW